jgi:hypothetical protein
VSLKQYGKLLASRGNGHRTDFHFCSQFWLKGQLPLALRDIFAVIAEISLSPQLCSLSKSFL